MRWFSVLRGRKTASVWLPAVPTPSNWHVHGSRDHQHDRGDEKHRHWREGGKTYFRREIRSDGTRVKCEGHWSVELGITDDWCYPQ